MNYGKAIRVTRALADVSQRELAKALGTDPSYISLLEGNKRQPSREVLEKLASALDVPLHLLVLMAAKGNDTGLSEEKRLSEIAETLASLLFAENTDGQRRTRSDASTIGKSHQARSKAPNKPRAAQRNSRRRSLVL